MSKKKKNYIDLKNTLNLFTGGYSVNVKQLNYYTFRLHFEEISDLFFDWYHTTGSLVKVDKGFNVGLGIITDPEDVAILVSEAFNKRLT
jgi:hypothetical protein